MPGKALRVMLCAWSCLLAGQASALGVGDITLHSALNQPLDADIELLDVGDLGADEIEVRLAGADVFAAAGVERLQFLNELRFSPVLQGRGGNRIHVSSSRPVQEPYLNFLVEVARPNGRIVREFTVLLDPLGYTPRMLPAARSGIEPQRQSSTPVPAPRSAAVVVDPALLEPGDEYLARPNDNLWAISGRLRGAGNADRAQLMEALYQLNPQAFVNADRHRLKAGARLRLPAGYQPERGAPGAVKEAAVEVLPPADAAVVENAPAALVEAQRQADAEAEALARQREELSQRMDDLQRQLQALQEQLQQRDHQVAELQQQLARRQAVRPAAPPPAAAAPSVAQPVETPTDSQYWRWMIVLLLVLALLGVLLLRRRREEAPVPAVEPKRRVALNLPLRRAPRPPAAAPAPAKVEEQARPPVAAPSSPPPSPPPAPAAAPRAAMAAADKLDGADIYIAYGRYGQARDLLRQVLAEQPQRLSARMKLLLVLAELGDAAGFDALAEETLASGGNPEAIDELRGRYPALLQMLATETPAATTKDDDWSDLPLAESPVLQQPDATSGADGFGDLNLDLDLDWGALENPLDNPDLPRRAAAGKAEPAEEPLAFESNLHELPDVAEYEHLELDQPEPATVPPEEASASLDRARACIDSGDLDQASRILRLVVAHGDPWQKAEARELLALIA
ncbi:MULTISPECIES: type IV pilus assembly protein FimV [Pseudomonas]|uniref:type IV pilus assembly protein FimV n=1 Tax=Pseudomonas TaxID=286 RepID=UPI000188FF80|nr:MULTISPECIES: FimV family protein [Pseudomonas]HCL2909827.1 FimV family protein [Pseudomonas aeruginosa 059A]AEO74112.1 putative Tfp pilus assembly protein FimV [Pseudomonas aeruginosa M18]AHC64370.1 Tfp pilus assembly protein FimV [Pseudomonas aeruginosa LES431]AHK82666.1 Tfp pilus assembly protein FimV [Pseudomonas aeruginosa LESlike5]AHK88569.1 Tfp pilus assembly protein FimV [Pseudomonas aeruginosa LESlike7]